MKTELKKIGIGIIHGMGDQNKNFSKSLIQDIKNYYEVEGKEFNSGELHFESIYWADVLNEQERIMWKKLKLSELHFDKYRRFVVNYFGDAIAYQKMYDLEKSRSRNDISVYYKVQNIISESLKSIEENTEDDSPLVLISHSLGSVMLLNYIHDSQKSIPQKNVCGWKNKCDADNLAGLFTCGNPFALWALRKENFGKAIKFPGKHLNKKIQKISRWYNIYDPEDILAFPIKNINDSYKKLKYLSDLKIEVDGLLTGNTPLAHLGYFTTIRIIKLISNYLRELRNSIG